MDDLVDALDHGGGGGQVPEVVLEPGGSEFGGGGAADSVADGDHGPSGETLDVSDAASGVDADELGVVLVALLALVGAAWAALWIIWSAPALFAELLLDAALAAGLYLRLRAVRGDHWLRTALRRTAWPFVAVTLLLALAGAVMQAFAPEATSLGEVIRYYQGAR